MAITRGFTGRRRQAERDPRLPPGQYDVGRSWPVLTAEPTPRVDAERWSLAIDGLVANPVSWSLTELKALATDRKGKDSYRGDIHCVTTWSKLDTSFTGIALDTLLEIAQPRSEATYVVEESTTRYRTNLPIDDVTGGKAWIVWEHEGKPLSREHGGPVRMLVPHLYFWKSAKWISKITLLDHDRPGFWEVNGYHDRGDPWLEQRFDGD
jgi:DMSO/TMAO reductase YedYZ molybdopterin-dependent catalytic subunit